MEYLVVIIAGIIVLFKGITALYDWLCFKREMRTFHDLMDEISEGEWDDGYM